MKEILLTSSVLILTLLLLRLLFRKTISRRVQYALWGLVALRLLVPVSLPAMEHNVLTAAEPVQAQVVQRLERQEFFLPVERAPLAQHPEAQDAAPDVGAAVTRPAVPAASDGWVVATDTTAVRYRQLTAAEILTYIWYAGMAVMAVWFLTANVRFAVRLRRSRRPYPAAGCKYPVYLAEHLPSPCLFGLLRPAVYLTPAAVESPETLRHVLAHETTHARHLDPLWSLLRCVCLAVYWFDPLVWIAAVVSRRDCELACDEGALKRLGEAERIPYGRTLLRLIPVARTPESPMLSATTMTAGKRELKDRVTRIAENRRTMGVALLAMVTAAALVCALTFTGAKPSVRSLTGEELSGYALAFNTADRWQDSAGNDCALRPIQFLTSVYDDPVKIDMYHLFYNGVSLEQPISAAERQELVDTCYDGYDPEVDLIKITAEQADHVLVRWVDLPLTETDVLNMGSFSYLANYDAYYHFHGDTNAPGDVCFYAGERSGDTVTLYYQPEQCGVYLMDTAGSGEEVWAKVTVEPQKDGGFHILSNQLCHRPDGLLGESRPLTGEELAFFNTEFFNSETADENGMANANYHNQFLTCLYDSPQNLNLFDLFYNGIGTWEAPSQAELEQLGVLAADGSQICPTYKLTTAAMDAFLLENTGLTLAQTNKVDLDAFDYLPGYDAYYLTKGDTNYRSVTFTSGQRRGDYIQLYWKDFYYGSETNECVTLLDRGDGQYWFVSHLLVDSDVPSAFAYPDGEPWMTLPLSGLTPYQPQKTTLTRHSMDCDQRGAGFIIDGTDGGEYSIQIYRSTDGNVYAAVMQSEAVGRDGMAEWEADVFFTFPNNVDVSNDAERTDLFFFHDLLGHSGFTVSYSDYLTGGPGRGGQIGEVTDYYYLDGDGVPCLLAHAKGDTTIMDLDGDGINELCAASGASGQIFFQRDSRFYEADVKSLLQDAWPELRYWESAQWDVSYRRMTVSVSADMPEWADAEHRDPSATAVRYVYYRDGELLVYKPDAAEATDHVVGTPDVPEAVVAAAKATVLEAYQSARTEGYNAGAEFDDWRVEYLAEDWSQTYSGGTLVAYNMNYEYHAGKPAAIILAGGAYVDEDGWCMPDYPYCHYLLFAEKDGQYTFLKEQMINDGGPGTPFFEAEMQRWAVELG